MSMARGVVEGKKEDEDSKWLCLRLI
jgi:hypothetical protein